MQLEGFGLFWFSLCTKNVKLKLTSHKFLTLLSKLLEKYLNQERFGVKGLGSAQPTIPTMSTTIYKTQDNTSILLFNLPLNMETHF